MAVVQGVLVWVAVSALLAMVWALVRVVAGPGDRPTLEKPPTLVPVPSPRADHDELARARQH